MTGKRVSSFTNLRQEGRHKLLPNPMTGTSDEMHYSKLRQAQFLRDNLLAIIIYKKGDLSRAMWPGISRPLLLISAKRRQEGTFPGSLFTNPPARAQSFSHACLCFCRARLIFSLACQNCTRAHQPFPGAPTFPACAQTFSRPGRYAAQGAGAIPHPGKVQTHGACAIAI